MKQFQLLLVSVFMLIAYSSTGQLNYLFSATSKAYVPVTGGTSPHLKSDSPLWEIEDEGFARIPIGFTFNYDGENYSKANVHVNGFITFRDSLDVFYNYPYFRNKLMNAPPYHKRPVIAAFWDDLVLADTLDLVYKTTGHAPFRVFTIEWKKVKWVYESIGPVLSIELKLYETTNIIEFQYKDEGGLADPRYAFATIGITSTEANRDFISLQNTSANPSTSLVRANDSLSVKPANNQVYKFKPATITTPRELESSLKYTHNSVSFRLQAQGIHICEYALTQTHIPPTSGILTSSSTISISGLTPATTYYIYGRSRGHGHPSVQYASNEELIALVSTRGVNPFYSQWVCDSFTTAVSPVELPYIATTEGVSATITLPPDMRQQDFQDTSYTYSTQNGFMGITDFFEPGDNAFLYFQVDYYNADAWLFTPGLNLTAGKTYQLKFSYLSLYEYNPGDPSSLEIKLGRETGAAAMTSGLLFKKTDITNDEVFRDTVIEFSPGNTGTYYIGFHDLSLFLQGFLVISKISVLEKIDPPEIPLVTQPVIPIHVTALYPNPAIDVLNIKIESAITSTIHMIVMDPSNKTWITQSEEVSQGPNSIRLAITRLPPGTYFLKINYNYESENVIKIFVKQGD